MLTIFFYVFSMKVELSKRLTYKIYGNDFFSIGSFIYYKHIY